MEDDAFVIRPITTTDYDWLYELKSRVELGFTSLPNNDEYLTKRIDTVTKSFADQIPQQQRIYLFVREDLKTGDRVGLSGIQACAGFDSIFYNFQISNVKQMSRDANVSIDHQLLNLVDNFQNASELISFWVDPNSRGTKIAKALSMTRFLHMAQFPQLFGNDVIAEIRGICDEDGKSPFWESVGSAFFGMDFVTADYLTMSTNKQFIADLVPKSPIYVCLLPKDAQGVIGKTSESAAPARGMLEAQGFRYNKYVDIFDAGPLLDAPLQSIKTVQDSVQTTITSIEDDMKGGTEVLVSTTELAMRATMGMVQVQDDGQVIVSKEVAEILQVDIGQQVRYAEI